MTIMANTTYQDLLENRLLKQGLTPQSPRDDFIAPVYETLSHLLDETPVMFLNRLYDLFFDPRESDFSQKWIGGNLSYVLLYTLPARQRQLLRAGTRAEIERRYGIKAVTLGQILRKVHGEHNKINSLYPATPRTRRTTRMKAMYKDETKLREYIKAHSKKRK